MSEESGAGNPRAAATWNSPQRRGAVAAGNGRNICGRPMSAFRTPSSSHCLGGSRSRFVNDKFTKTLPLYSLLFSFEFGSEKNGGNPKGVSGNASSPGAVHRAVEILL